MILNPFSRIRVEDSPQRPVSPQPRVLSQIYSTKRVYHCGTGIKSDQVGQLRNIHAAFVSMGISCAAGHDYSSQDSQIHGHFLRDPSWL